MRIVILGCGRLGAKVAEVLDRDGHDITVIANDPEDFHRLSRDFRGRTTLGDGTDVDVLRANGVEQADAFVAVANGDNTNVMASQIAKHVLGVPQVISQIKDPIREDTYHAMGIQTICPTRLGADKIHDAIVGGT